MRIIDKIQKLLEEEQDQTYYSYEYFPPKTTEGEENLVDRISRMSGTNPLWVDMTWGAGGSSANTTLDLCGYIARYMGLDVLMHITCTGMTREYLIECLDRAKELGIQNILALRGDPPAGVENWTPVDNGFEYASQLVKFIKERYGNHFCIVVAGYPEMHSQATSKDDDIKHLKEKCDAGADVIITQLFYDTKIFIEWVKDCRAAGIQAQIIPGIMPILGYERFQRTVSFCKTNVPDFLSQELAKHKDDDEAVREFGVQFGARMCQELMDSGVKFLHFYTMNLEVAVIKIIQKLGILKKYKALPFQPHASADRSREETVRPIFWANNSQSYLARTGNWDEFPNGRWGVSRSAAYGGALDEQESLGGFVSFSKKFQQTNIKEKKKLWGERCLDFQDVQNCFVNYISGKLQKFPFSEGTLALETSEISEILVKMNQNKLFTINSQPKVNGVRSDDERFGWGPKNGRVYQKAYFEFFIPPALVSLFVTHLQKYEQISFQAINLQGNSLQNVDINSVNAVTWGVFCNKEVAQPTVVDHKAFLIWKNEALQNFHKIWASIYQDDQESKDFLKRCASELYLMNIVDNDYVDGDLNKVIEEFIETNKDFIDSLTSL